MIMQNVGVKEELYKLANYSLSTDGLFLLIFIRLFEKKWQIPKHGFNLFKKKSHRNYSI